MAGEYHFDFGPWQPKITRIHQMWTQPCGINLFVWMLGYFAASPQLVYSFANPDCVDHTADRVKPKKRGRGCKNGRPRRHGTYNMADFADALSPPGKKEGWIGFQLLGWAQRVGFYFTLIDAVQDWIIHGTSFAYQWSGCNDPNQGYAFSTMDKAIPVLQQPGEFHITTWARQNDHIFIAGPSGTIVPKGHGSSVAWTITQHPNEFPPLKDANVTFWMENVASVADRWDPIEPVVHADGSKTWTLVSPQAGSAAEGAHYRVYGMKDFGVVVVSGHLVVSGYNMEGIAKTACGHNLEGGF